MKIRCRAFKDDVLRAERRVSGGGVFLTITQRDLPSCVALSKGDARRLAKWLLKEADRK